MSETNKQTETISAKLRRWADDSNTYDKAVHCIASESLGFCRPNITCFECKRVLFRHIADEIDREIDAAKCTDEENLDRIFSEWIRAMARGERDFPAIHEAIDRYYLPRPLFDDGEPVQDSDIEGIGGLSTCCVYTDGSWKFDPDEHEDERNPKQWIKQTGRKDERVKRPNPQVLDADGVPIEIGDKVWLLPGKHCETFPLYGCKAGVEYMVSENNSAVHKGDGRICITGGDVISGYPMPEQVTHREPDTQERIDDDATMPPRAYYAKHIGHDVGLKDDEEVWTAVTAHLLRRQRELDGRDA